MIPENELTKKYFPYFDGLRAFSILWVIFHHLPIELPEYLNEIRIRGSLGVEFFFAISGLLVFRSLHQCFLKKNNDNFEFIKRRIFRIFPPYFLTLIVIYFLSKVDHGLSEKISSIKDIQLSFPLFYYNYAKNFTTGIVPGTLNIFWSLCFEEQFYLYLFLVSLFFRNKIHKGIFLLLIFSLGCKLYYLFFGINLNAAQIQMYTHLRTEAILLSCLGYYYWNVVKDYLNKLSWIIFLMIPIVIIYTKIDGVGELFLMMAISIICTLFVFSLINSNDHFLTKILSSRTLSFIGLISYEIYLIHEIVVGAAVKLGLKDSPFLFILFSYVFSILAGYIFFKLFSNPINQRLRKKFLIA